MAQVDINHPPKGGFLNGGWYWDPKVGKARQYWSGSFGDPDTINNPNQPGYKGPTQGGNAIPATSGQGNPLQQINDAVSNSFQKLENQVTKAFKDYTGSNPFSYDKVLADKTTEAKEQVDPYYDQLLGDYLDGVQRKLDRGFNDTQDLLGELSASKASFVTENANSAARAAEDATQQFADAGLAGSGAALRAEGLIKQGAGADMADYTRKANLGENQINNNLLRGIQDTNAAKKDYVTNLERNRFTDVGTRAGQLTKEAGQQYVQGFQQTLPTELQSASGFDMLKSLGIYG